VLKTFGYLISTLSVLLLGVVSWKSASEQPLLAICLLGGMAASIVGMFLRWLSHEADRKRKLGAVAQLASPSDSALMTERGSSAANGGSVVTSRS
jgi:hypothetical protein